MPASASSLHHTISRLRGTTSRRSVRYPLPLRREILDFARRRGAAGDRLKEIAQDLGLPWQTLHRWLERSPRRRFRPVAVVAIPPAPAALRSSVSIVTPQGFRVEGLDLESAADLLKRLG